MSISFVFFRKFEAGHRLVEGENGKTICAQPHGHTWNVRAFMEPIKDKVLDQKENTFGLFSKIKGDWHRFIDNHIDHSFLFNSNDPLLQFMIKDLPCGRHVTVPGDPTTEMVSVLLKSKLQAILKASDLGLQCYKLELFETQTNGIICEGDPSVHLPKDPTGNTYWWNRADMSTNDLGIKV
jgi:6-pyruvoyltetrahydropterin/6-carboxytetrahydropterin synthase